MLILHESMNSHGFPVFVIHAYLQDPDKYTRYSVLNQISPSFSFLFFKRSRRLEPCHDLSDAFFQ